MDAVVLTGLNAEGLKKRWNMSPVNSGIPLNGLVRAEGERKREKEMYLVVDETGVLFITRVSQKLPATLEN